MSVKTTVAKPEPRYTPSSRTPRRGPWGALRSTRTHLLTPAASTRRACAARGRDIQMWGTGSFRAAWANAPKRAANVA